jgi:hypothetical protein
MTDKAEPCFPNTAEVSVKYLRALRRAAGLAINPEKMEGMGGCLCIGCLERRIGRRLKRKDFPDHELNWLSGTPRLRSRQK